MSVRNDLQNSENRSIALLIDAENVSSKYVKLIFDELSEIGVPTYKRVYGDIDDGKTAAWKKSMMDYSLSPAFQLNYTRGKSASDTALIIDAMDILHTGDVDAFCIVSSDSDYTKLINRLREGGKIVIGMGEHKTPKSLVAACDTFKFLDLLYKKDEAKAPVKRNTRTGNNKNTAGKTAKASPDGIDRASLKELEETIWKIIDSQSEEQVILSSLGSMLGRRIPGFDPRNYGFPTRKLRDFIEVFNDSLDIQDVAHPNHPGANQTFVKRKQNA